MKKIVLGVLCLMGEGWFLADAFGLDITFQIREPGVGTPDDDEVFVVVMTDGYPEVARQRAIDEIRFQARHKRLTYQICGTSEEKMVFGCRVTMHYRLKPMTVETPAVESVWWQDFWVKMVGHLRFLRETLAKVPSLVRSFLPPSS